MADDTDNQEPVDPLTVGELITLQEAAEYAGLAKSSLHEYAKKGRLKAKKLGLYWVTTRAAVDEYLASRSLDNIPKKYRDRP
jgi:excisionase family DNA binding protein